MSSKLSLHVFRYEYGMNNRVEYGSVEHILNDSIIRYKIK